jgi:hypothetical protein
MLKKSKFAPEHKSVSRVPNGGYTLTSGSNYMLDGFQFDTEYNGGVLEKARLPEAKGLSSLPSGMIPNDSPLFSEIPSHTDDEGGIHLGDFIKEASDQYVPIVDHSWLAKTPKENLEGARSKKDIYEEMDEGFYSDSNLKELESAWGTSTTGLDLVPNENRKHPKYTNPERDIDSLPGDDYRASIEKAMRRSAYGEPIRTIVADLKNEMGRRYNESIGEKIASEHGLHGKVYIREEAFPGLFNGRWDKTIKKRCASAMYIIPNAQDCAYDYHQSRKVVNTINWKKAFDTYAPKLKTVGIKIGSGDNYKQRLKSAFLSTAPAPVQPQTWFETQEDLTKRYTTDQAQELLDEYTPEVDYVDSINEREERVIQSKFATLLDKFLKLGMITEDQYDEIASIKDVSKKTAKLNNYATLPKEASDYMGLGVGKKGMFGKVIQEIDPHYTTPQQRELQAQENKFNRLASDLLRLGLASENQINKIASMDTDHFNKTKELTKIAAKPVLTKKGSYIGSGLNISTMEGKKYSNEFSKIDSAEERELAIRTRVAQDKIQRLVNANLISMKQVEKIACGCSSPEQVVEKSINSITQDQTDISSRPYSEAIFEQINLLKEANNDFFAFQKELSQRMRKDYQAMKEASSNISDKEYNKQEWVELNKLKQARNEFDAVQKEITLRLKKASAMPLLQKEKELLLINDKIENKISSLVESQLVTREQVENITYGVSNPQKKLAKVLDFLTRSEKKNYTDTQFTAHIIKNKKPRTLLASAESVEKWVRQKMAEGNMGKDLDVLLQTKFASEVLDHYGEKIGSLRKAHEGLSGQVYVDAKAYDTPNGVTGCEQGALQHRANTIPAVLQMDKCATCVYKNAEDICQKYNKPIIASVELLGIDNPRKYQKEAIKLANSSDSEKTASLFANNYDEDEFSLTTNDELEIDDEQTPQALADVLFGGFEV